MLILESDSYVELHHAYSPPRSRYIVPPFCSDPCSVTLFVRMSYAGFVAGCKFNDGALGMTSLTAESIYSTSVWSRRSGSTDMRRVRAGVVRI